MALLYDQTKLLSKIIQKTIQLQLTKSSSFYIFKNQTTTEFQLLPNTSLPINRYVNPMSLMKSAPYFSLWSSCHLQSLQSLKKQHPTFQFKSDYVIKNPCKDQELINKSFQLGISNYIVDSFEQLYKLHKAKKQYLRDEREEQNDEQKKLRFIWDMSDEEAIQKLTSLRNYKINISGLLFKSQQNQKIERIIRMVIQMGHKLNYLMIETTKQNYNSIHKQFNQNLYLKQHLIKPIVQISDYSQVQEYTIMAKVSGINRSKELIVKQQVYQYLNQEDIQKANVIQIKGKQWILTKVKKFPCFVTLNQHNSKGIFDYIA